MADFGRKSVTTQVTEKVTPQSQKTTGEKVKESVTGALDNAKAALTPDSHKSLPQQAADGTRGRKHENDRQHVSKIL